MIKNNNTTFHSHPVRLSKVERFIYSCILSVILQMRHFSSLLILNIWLFQLQPFAALYLSFVLHSSVILLKMYFHKCFFFLPFFDIFSNALCIITEGWNLPLSYFLSSFFFFNNCTHLCVHHFHFDWKLCIVWLWLFLVFYNRCFFYIFLRFY